MAKNLIRIDEEIRRSEESSVRIRALPREIVKYRLRLGYR